MNAIIKPINNYLHLIQNEIDEEHSLKARVMAFALPFFAMKAAIYEAFATVVRIPGFVINITFFVLAMFAPTNSEISIGYLKLEKHLPNPISVTKGAAKVVFCVFQIILAPLIGTISPKANQKMFTWAGLNNDLTKKPKQPPQEKPPIVLGGFDDVVGMDTLKASVQPLLYQLKHPQLAKYFGVGIPNGALLTGPPGCGKTFFASKFCEEAQKQLGKPVSFHEISASTTGGTFVHETAIKIGKIFKQAEAEAKQHNSFSIIFIDEIDTMFPAVQGGYASASRDEEQGVLLQQLNNAGSRNIFVMAASNHPEKLSPELTRAGRFDFKIEVPLPDEATIIAILRKSLPEHMLAEDINLNMLTEKLNGSNIAEVTLICNMVKAFAFRETVERRSSDPNAPPALINVDMLSTALDYRSA